MLDVHASFIFLLDLLELRPHKHPESGFAPIGHVPDQSQQFEINYRGCSRSRVSPSSVSVFLPQSSHSKATKSCAICKIVER